MPARQSIPRPALVILLSAICISFSLGMWFGKTRPSGNTSSRPGTTQDTHRPSFRSSGNYGSRTQPYSGLSLRAEDSEWIDSDFLTSDQIESVVENIIHCQDPLQQDLLFSHLLTKVTAENAKSCWQSLTKNSKGRHGDLRRFSLLAYTWGIVHGHEAVKTARDGNTPEHNLLSRHAIEGWATASPSLALAYMKGEDGFKSKSCRMGLMKGLGRADPLAASSYLVELEQFTDARPYLKPVIDSQMNNSFQEAENWVKDLPSDRLKEQGLVFLAQKMFDKSPEQATSWVDSFIQEPYAAGAAAAVAAHLLAKSEIEPSQLNFALNWLSNLPDGETKNAAYESSMRSWTKRDPDAAAEHLNNLNQSPEKDRAVRSYSLETAQGDPSSAVLWAASIYDGTIRHGTLVSTAKTWLRRDPDAANTWLRAADLEEKTLLAIRGQN